MDINNSMLNQKLRQPSKLLEYKPTVLASHLEGDHKRPVRKKGRD